VAVHQRHRQADAGRALLARCQQSFDLVVMVVMAVFWSP
jgi:hypothetical protein